MVLEAFSYESTRNLPRLKMTEFCVSGTDVLFSDSFFLIIDGIAGIGPEGKYSGKLPNRQNDLITHAQLSA